MRPTVAEVAPVDRYGGSPPGTHWPRDTAAIRPEPPLPARPRARTGTGWRVPVCAAAPPGFRAAAPPSGADCQPPATGPAYVSGPVTVIGSDIYGLDRDGDGYGCD